MSRRDLLDETHSTQLGRSILLRSGEAQSIIRAFGDDHASQVMSVAASMEIRPPLSGLVEVVGTLRWGVGGHQNFAEFDFLQGTVMSVPASYVEVLAQIVSGVTGEVRVGASVGYGSRPSSVPSVFRTIKMTTSALTKTDFIPRWASVGIVAFDNVTSPVTTLTLAVLSHTGDVLYLKSLVPGESFPVLSGANRVQITTSRDITVNVQYALVL